MSGPFSGPLFKRLTPTDAGVSLAKISGVTLLRDIRDFLPRPTGQPRRATVRAQLVDDGAQGRRTLGEVKATLQAQGGGGKAVEVYLSDIGALRELCLADDLLLIEPSMAPADPDFVRVTRVATTSPRFSGTDARTGGRDSGVLSGAVLPRTWETGRLRAVGDASEVLVADFSVTGRWPEFEITFESKDGHGRNPDYEKTFELVLNRLAALDATLTGARITSERMLATDDGGAAFEPAGLVLPFGIVAASAQSLRKSLVLAGSRVGVPPTGNGNTTRRMTLTVELGGPPLPLLEVEERLAGTQLALGAIGPGDEPPQPALIPPLTLETDLASIDEGFAAWREALMSGSRPLRGRLRWIDGDDFGFRLVSSKRPDAVDVWATVRQSGAPWTVEVNAPVAAADANRLSSLAKDQNGRRVLIRQGRLKKNSDSDGEISKARFRQLSCMNPIEVTGGSTPLDREWFVVADVDAPPEKIRSDTARFIHACAAARSRSLGTEVPAAAPPLEAQGEKGGVYTLPFRPALPERLVQRRHGDVWQALSAVLEPRGVRMVKLRHEAGYEIDGVVYTGMGPLLLEIKTGSSASDVYEGVGQLTLYAEMMNIATCRRVLLLPFQPASALRAALEACGIHVHTFDADADLQTITFPKEFLDLCGVTTQD